VAESDVYNCFVMSSAEREAKFYQSTYLLTIT